MYFTSCQCSLEIQEYISSTPKREPTINRRADWLLLLWRVMRKENSEFKLVIHNYENWSYIHPAHSSGLHIWIELSVAVNRMYVNNSNCDSLPFKIYFAVTSSSWPKCRLLDWRLSQPGFAPSYWKLVCLATLMSSDWTKQICLWMTIYIYILSTTGGQFRFINSSLWLDTQEASSWDRHTTNFTLGLVSSVKSDRYGFASQYTIVDIP